MTLPRRSLPLLALALLGLAWAEAWLEIPWVTGNVRRDPEGTAARRADRAIAAMRARFRRMAQEADRVATNLAGGAMVRTGLARPEPEGARDLFDAVIASGWEGLEGGGLEVVRADGTVVAWNGHTPVPGDALAESGVVRRRLEPGPLHLWYVVAMPVLPLAGGTVPIGSVRAGVPIESRPGLHPRFRRNATLSEAALAAGAADARVAAGRAHATAGGAWIAAPLDPDRPGLGAIEVRAPSPEHLLSEAGRAPRLRAQFLTLVLVAALGIALARALRRKLAGARAGARRALALLPWALRWAVVLLGLPASGTGGPVFDPASYSNGALGGLFATPAEFLLTAIAALASVGLLLREAPGRSPSDVPRRRLAQAAVGGAMAVAAAWICALAVESVVRDSTLEHFDPAEPLPSGAVLALHAGLWLLALSGFLLASGWIAASTGARELGAYAGGAVAGLAAALVGAPETIPAAPLAGGIALYAGGVWFCRAWTLPQRIMLSGLFAALLLHPCFDAAREEDVRRTLLQGLPDVLAPQDGYFEHEAESAAERLAADPDVRTLVSSWRAAPPDPSAAVDLWRRTVAGLGCDAAVRVLDASRAEITALAVNFPPKEDWQGELPALPEQTRTWNVRLPGEVRVDVYAAHAGVLDDSGTPAGSVVVALSPPGRSLAGTSFPEAEAPGKSLPRVRVSRFTGDGDAGLPAPAAAHFRGSTSTEPWHDRHRVGERELETLYAREPDGAGIVAMTYEPPRALERGAAFLALFLGNSAPALAAALAVFAVLAWPHRPAGEGPAAVGRKAARHLARMENQLLAFFLAVSLVPIVLLSVLSRALVRDRIESAVGEDTLRAVGVAQRFFASERTQKRDIPEGAAVPLEPFCRRFAALSGKDLSAFVPGRLGATSKPELFDLGIHPRRVPARAYRALVLDEQESRLETWSAGRLQYQVAFQALRQEGRTARVFAVPVLFNRREVDAETGRATVLVFGSYGLVLLLLWAGALGLAERLARPVRRLLEGTRRVAAGELDFRIEGGAGGEMGELIEGFNRMTSEVKVGRDNLARAERETAWREMARQIAHEIKNPLTPMKLSAQEIGRAARDRDPELEPIVQSGVRTIVQQIDLLGRIATEFSTFARLPAGMPAPVDLNALARDAARLFERGGSTPIRVELDLQEPLPAVLADADQMHRVLTNLCRNAVQAMPAGGTITLRTRQLDGAAARVRLSVKDGGPGIPPEVMPRIFEPYFSTRTEGTGLGLAICKRIVEDVGGRIEAESRPGEGATFTIEMGLGG